MIRCGKVCKTCQGSCDDCPDEASPLHVQCPSCGGGGCESCGDGRIRITTCPSGYVGSSLWQFTTYADLFARGLPPVAGGALDQAQVFTNASRFYQNECNRWKAQSNPFGMSDE